MNAPTSLPIQINRQAALKACIYFRDLAPNLIAPTRFPSDVRKPCHLGLHLRHVFGKNLLGHTSGYMGSLAGIDAFAQALGGNRAHAIVLLRAAGAPHDPFDDDKWPVPIGEVFRKLYRRILDNQTLPSLKNTDFQNMDFNYADLNRSDFSGANFSGAQMAEANLGHAKLHSAVLDKTRAVDADFCCADMNGASCREGNFEKADLSGAMLEGADFTGSSLLHADLYEAKIEGADFTDVDLRACDFRHTEMEKAKNIHPPAGVITADSPAP